MHNKYLFLKGLLILLLVHLPLTIWANEPPKSSGQPIFMIDGAWNPSMGAWSRYKIIDLEDDKISYMYFATLEHDRIGEKPCRWMEIFVETVDESDNPVEVATRILATEGDNGPENVVTVIVQPSGFPPFTVPDSMLNAEDSAQSEMKHVSVDPGSIKTKLYTMNGRSIKAYEVKGQDAEGHGISATVSGQVAPLGLVEAETANLSMRLLDFGVDAQTLIDGTPMNFYLWIARIVSEGIEEATQ